MIQSRYSNCLIFALYAWIARPRSTSVKAQRNRLGRWHFYWVSDGVAYEFYARGRSGNTYMQNALYRGRVRKIRGLGK